MREHVLLLALLLPAILAPADGATFASVGDSILCTCLPDTLSAAYPWFINGRSFAPPHVVTWDAGKLRLHREEIWPGRPTWVPDGPHPLPTQMDSLKVELARAVILAGIGAQSPLDRLHAMKAVYDASPIITRSWMESDKIHFEYVDGGRATRELGFDLPHERAPAADPLEGAVQAYRMLRNLARNHSLVLLWPPGGGTTIPGRRADEALAQIEEAITTGRFAEGPVSADELQQIREACRERR